MLCGIELKEMKGDNETQVITIARRHETRVVTQTVLVPLPTAHGAKRLCVEATTVGQQSTVPGDVHSQLAALQCTLMSCDVTAEPVAKDSDVTEINRQLDVCKAKFSELKSAEDKARQLCEQSSEGKSLEADLASFNLTYSEIVQRLGERQLYLTKALESTPPAAFIDALSAFLQWMNEAEALLGSEKFFVDELDVVEHQLQQYLNFEADVKAHQSNYDYLSISGQSLLQKTVPGDVASKLESDLAILPRWTPLIETVNQRVSQCRATVDQLKLYNSQVAAVRRWLADVEGFLVPAQLADSLDTLRFELRESQAVERDVKSMQDAMSGIHSTSRALMEAAGSGAFREKLRLEVEELDAAFEAVANRSHASNARLQATVQRVDKLTHDIRGIEEWLDGVLARDLKQDFTASSPESLSEFSAEFKKIESEMAGKEIAIQQANEAFSGLSGEEETGDLEDVTCHVEQMNSKWNRLQALVAEMQPKVNVFTQNFTSFITVMREEQRWLDQLDKKLSVGPRPSGDAEELSEELDDLENFLHSQKSGNMDQLSLHAHTLIDTNVLSASVCTDFEGYKLRYDTLINKAKELMVQLEESIMQAQNREGRILDMSQWMTEMNDLLQSRLDADILAGDIPKEYESLKLEFSQHEQLLKELEAEAVLFRQQKKFDAAARLEEQISLLKKHFVEVSAKFLKFQRPADFDNRLTHVKRLLDDVDRSLHLIELVSDDTETVQNKFDQCVKLYKTMSEIKGDVEYVIKTGRQVVERKQVDFPTVLTSQIDAIKRQFNELGAQVTRGKASLERALKLSKGFHKELANIDEFISNLHTELVRRESSKTTKDIDSESAWIEMSQAQLAEKQMMLTTLNDVLAQFVKLSEENAVYDSELETKRVGEQMNELNDRLAARDTTLQALSAKLDEMYIEFSSKQRVISAWMDTTDEKLHEIVRTSVTERVSVDEDSVADLQRLASERNSFVSPVDEVRDLAVELINKSGKYSETVEAELTTFNQQWQDIELQINAASRPTATPVKEPIIVDSKAVRAEAALTQLLADDKLELDESLTSSSLITSISQFQSNLSSPATQTFRDDDDIQRKLQEMEAEEERIRVTVDQLLELESDSQNNATSPHILDVQTRWNAAKAESEERKYFYMTSSALFQQWTQKSHDVELRLEDVQSQMDQAVNDNARVLGVQNELESCELQLQRLHQQQTGFTSGHTVTRATLQRLNQQLSLLQQQVVQDSRDVLVAESPAISVVSAAAYSRPTGVTDVSPETTQAVEVFNTSSSSKTSSVMTTSATTVVTSTAVRTLEQTSESVNSSLSNANIADNSTTSETCSGVVDEVILPQQSSSYVSASRATEAVQAVELQSASAVGSSSAKEKDAPMPNLDSFAMKLNNFAIVLNEKAKSLPVIIGNVEEIEAGIKKKKVPTATLR